MLENIKGRIFSFGDNGRSFYVQIGKRSKGVNRSQGAAYFLTKQTYPHFISIRIRIKTSDMDSLVVLDNGARISLAEKLIADQLSRVSRRQKSREPPATEIAT